MSKKQKILRIWTNIKSHFPGHANRIIDQAHGMIIELRKQKSDILENEHLYQWTMFDSKERRIGVIDERIKQTEEVIKLWSGKLDPHRNKLVWSILVPLAISLVISISAPKFLGMSEKSTSEQAAVGNIIQSKGTNATPDTPTLPPRGLGTPSQVGEEEVKVVRVVDGDTIEAEINGKTEPVRYIGIDTPETVDPRKPVQCFGVEASKKNKELVEGKMVRLEKDITERDKYNRLLRYIWLGDTLINQALVEQGFAKSYSYPPDIKYQDRFVAAEKKAREDKLGLWTACVLGATSNTPIPSPQDLERQYGFVSGSSPQPTPASNPSCTIKGNISTSGEKIYHMQGCGSYAKTQIDEKRGERLFCSESEAQSAGWRKALNCP